MNAANRPFDRDLVFKSPLFAVIILDAKGQIADLNEKASRLFENHTKSLVNQPIHSLCNQNEFHFEDIKSKNTAGNLWMNTAEGTDTHFQFSFTYKGLMDSDDYQGCLILVETPERSFLPKDERFYKIFHSTVFGLAIVDDDQKVLEINESVSQITGYSKEEIIEKNTSDLNLLSAEDAKKSEEVWKNLKEKGFVQNLERVFHTKTGTLKHLSISIDNFFIGNERFWLVRLNDITTKKEAENRLQRAYQKLSNHLYNSPLGFIEYDQNFQVTEWSPKSEEIFKWTREEILNNNITAFNLVFEEDLKNTSRVAEELISGKVNGNISFNRNYTKTGEIVECVWYNSSVKNAAGEVVSVMSLVQDITEQNEYKKNIILEKELSDNIINSLPGVFYLYDENGKILRWNRNFETVTDYSPEEISQMHPLDFFDNDEKEFLKEKIKNVFISGEDNAEANFLLKSGEKIPYYFTGTAIKFKNIPCLMGVGIDISKRINAQKSLQKSLKQLTTAQQIAKIGYWEMEWDNRSTYWSDEMYTLCGSDKEDGPIEYSEFLQMVHPVDRERVQKGREKMMKNGTQNDTEFRFLNKKGVLLRVRARSAPIYDQNGNITRLEGTFQDITDSWNKEEEIRNSNERFELIAKATNDAIWDWDINTNKIWGNKRLYELYGMEDDKTTIIDDEMFFSRIHPEDVKGRKLTLSEALRQSQPSIVEEYRFKHPDGSYWFILDKAYVIFDASGMPVRILGAMQDITEWKKVEKELRELSNRLVLATDSASLGIFDWDIHNNKMVWNEYMYKIYDVPPETFYPTYEEWIQCLYPRDADAFDAQVKLALNEGKGFHHKYRVVWPNNEIRHIEVHALIIRGAGNRPVSMIGVNKDITESVNAEQYLAKTIIKTQEEERFDIGRELHDNIVQLLVASQINLNHAKNLINEPGSPINKSYQYIGTAIEEIRKLSHRLAPSTIDEKPIDETIQKLLNSMNAERQYEVSFEYDEGEQNHINSEIKLTLYRILQEQLNNIIKHSKASKIDVVFRANEFRVFLKTSDNGIGFDPKTNKGGIGLKNIKRRVEIFNGNLQLVSAPNHGCEITVEIPLANS